MDIIRNVGIRESIPQGASKITDTDISSLAMKLADSKLNRNSLPNIVIRETEPIQPATPPKSVIKSTGGLSAKVNMQSSDLISHTKNDDGEDEEECAVSGRLEIRVIQQQEQQQHQKQQQQNHEPIAKNSPNREESIYFDASANGQIGSGGTEDGGKCVRKLATNKTQTNTSNDTADGNCEPPTDETAFFSTTNGRLHESQKLSNDDNAADTFVSAATTLAKNSNVMIDNNMESNAIQLCNANDSSTTNGTYTYRFIYLFTPILSFCK